MAKPSAPDLLAVHRFGLTSPDAPTLVLLHGLTDSGLCWPGPVARWAASYRILAIDALGHGASRRLTSDELAGHAGDAGYAPTIATIEHELAGGPAPVLVGHSMGGLMATAIVARRPDLVRAAVLEDPAWLLPRQERPREERASGWLADHRAFVERFDETLAKGRAENPRWPEIDFEPWAQSKLEVDEAFLASGIALLSDPWPSLVDRIERPTLVVTGTDETIVPQALPALEALDNPFVEVRVVEGAGHTVRRDDPDAYHAIVDPWLAAVFARA
jgi:pimeloyl-ACP methyl ester carboxylesterase